MTRIAATLALALLAAAAAGDVIVRNDGSEVVGDLRRDATRDGYVVTGEDGGETFVPAAEVARVVVGRDTVERDDDAPASAVGSLDLLRRGVANLDDLPRIVAEYEAFVAARDPADPEAVTARAELAEWRRRLDRGELKLGGEWVTPDERDRRLADALGRVNEARLAAAAGDAGPATALLDDESTAAAGEYLLGVLAYEDGRLAEARSRFQKVRDLADAPHAPTLSNLAAIEVDLGRPDRATWAMAAALDAAPGTAQIVDNAAELGQLAGDLDDRNARRFRSLFERQEAELVARRAAEGLHRWGSGWVAGEEYERLSAIQGEVDAAVAELRREYDEVVEEVARVDERARANVLYMSRLEAASTGRDAQGNTVRLPLPPEYYAAERDNKLLLAERGRLAARAAELEEAAAAERAKVPAPPFAGALTLIGPDGVPVTLPPAAPATRPAR